MHVSDIRLSTNTSAAAAAEGVEEAPSTLPTAGESLDVVMTMVSLGVEEASSTMLNIPEGVGLSTT